MKTASSTLDYMLPPSKDENAEKNGLIPTRECVGEGEGHKRGVILVQQTYNFMTTMFRRAFGVCQTQVGNAANATDSVYKHVRNAVVRPKPFYTVTL